MHASSQLLSMRNHLDDEVRPIVLAFSVRSITHQPKTAKATTVHSAPRQPHSSQARYQPKTWSYVPMILLTKWWSTLTLRGAVAFVWSAGVVCCSATGFGAAVRKPEVAKWQLPPGTGFERAALCCRCDWLACAKLFGGDEDELPQPGSLATSAPTAAAATARAGAHHNKPQRILPVPVFSSTHLLIDRWSWNISQNKFPKFIFGGSYVESFVTATQVCTDNLGEWVRE